MSEITRYKASDFVNSVTGLNTEVVLYSDHAAEVQRLQRENAGLLRQLGDESQPGFTQEEAYFWKRQLATAEARAERLEALYREERDRIRFWDKIPQAEYDAATEQAIAATKAEEKKQ